MAGLKIAVISQFYAPVSHGGAEISTQMLAEALVARGNCVVVGTTLVHKLPAYQKINHVSVNRKNWGNVYAFDGSPHSVVQKSAWHVVDAWNPVAFVKAKKWFAMHKPDVVHTNNLAGMSVAVWSAAHALKIPIIHTVYDYYLLCLRSSMYRHGSSCINACRDCMITSMLKKLSAKQVHSVVYITKHICDVHAKAAVFSSRVRSHIVGQIVLPANRSKNAPKSTGQLRVGYCGRLTPSKGIEWLLEFLEASQFKNVAKLLVAGKGDPDYVDQIKARFRNAKCVFLGHVVPQLLFDQIDVLVVPSLWNEPMGRVPLEAASAGIPSIVANRGGLPETVTHGVTGFVFDPSDSVSLAECLASLVSDNSRLIAMKNAAFESSLSHSEDHIASKYEEIYRDALALS